VQDLDVPLFLLQRSIFLNKKSILKYDKFYAVTRPFFVHTTTFRNEFIEQSRHLTSLAIKFSWLKLFLVDLLIRE